MSGHTPSELVTLLRERSLALSGRSIDRGCQDSGISANLCDEAADLIAANEAKIEALTTALTLAEDVLSRSPFSTAIWPNGMHPQTGMEQIRAALTSAGDK